MWNIHATIFDEVGWFFDLQLQLQSEFIYKEFHSHLLLFLIRDDVIRITVKKNPEDQRGSNREVKTDSFSKGPTLIRKSPQ